MNAPIASTNMNTPTAPKSLPTPKGTTTPVSTSCSP